MAGVAVAGLLLASCSAQEQTAAPSPAPTQAAAQQQTGDTAVATPVMGQTKREKLSKSKEDKVVQSKDTRKQLRKDKKTDPLAGQDAKLPDKQLYDKSLDALKRGHFDVARLDLQTLLNTYPDSQYQMRAKLAIADSWYKEGGTAALTQAESEYADFRVFFPNAPEAAEAQMRIGDIYFRQMDKPDRDYAKAVHSQEEYRRMLTDYPDSTLVPQARQRLREVQEVLAEREAEIAAFYATRENWPATIARYQTVSDTYPQYSHMDDVLVGLGDSYEAEARFVRSQKLPEAAKARLEKIYDDRAADAYRRVVLEHAASPHVEDARDRLEAMSMPIPAPTAEQVAASTALENSRAQYRLQDRAKLLFLHQPDVVAAARAGDPPLVDAKPTLAPTVTKQIFADFNGALNPGAAPVSAVAAPAAPAEVSGAATAATSAAATPAAPLALSDVPAAGADTAAGSSAEMTSAPSGSTGNAAASMGVEIVTPNTGSNGTITPAAGTGALTPNADASNGTGGLHAVGPANTAPLPPVEKASGAPDAVNDITPGTATPPAQAPRADGKRSKPAFDKSDESSSKHKKKKGIAKVNPF